MVLSVLVDGGWLGRGVGVNRGGDLPGGGDGCQLARGHRDSDHQRHQPCHLQQNNQELINNQTGDDMFVTKGDSSFLIISVNESKRYPGSVLNCRY